MVQSESVSTSWQRLPLSEIACALLELFDRSCWGFSEIAQRCICLASSLTEDIARGYLLSSGGDISSNGVANSLYLKLFCKQYHSTLVLKWTSEVTEDYFAFKSFSQTLRKSRSQKWALAIFNLENVNHNGYFFKFLFQFYHWVPDLVSC